MLEYSIGSVADLISGSKTPNKQKVVKKEFKAKNKTPTPVKSPGKAFSPYKNQKKVQEKHSLCPKSKKFKAEKRKVDESEEEEEIITPNKKALHKRVKKQSITPKVKRRKPDVSDESEESDGGLDMNVAEDEEESNPEQNKSSSEEESEDINVKNNDESSDDDESEDEPHTKEESEESNEEESDDEANIKEKDEESSDEDESDDGAKLKEKDESSDNEESDDSDVNIPTKAKVDPKPKNTSHTTVFVGNLPVTITHNKLKKLFSKFGSVVNARIRSVPVANPGMSKKVAAITKQFHPDRKSLHGYVTFTTRDDALKALTFNGKEYKDHHIRVNMCDDNQKPDKNKAIFLGNVSFAAEEEELWKLFQSCGEIESVRLVRDRRTDIGRGFGYINFKSSDSVELALQMGEVKLRDRVLRVSLYNGKAPKKAKPQNPKGNKQKKGPNIEKTGTNGEFQGKTASQKKKKYHKGNQLKKKVANKIAPKSNS